MEWEAAVDELYALEPGSFTARRDALATAATRDGDTALAQQVRALRRPTAAAAAVNRLAREAGDELAVYLAVGERLRAAQAGLRGAELRRLGQARQQAASALVERAAGLVGGLSDAVRQEVDETLRAAVADPAASEVVASGRLAKALTYAGFGEVDITAAAAAPLTRSDRRPKAAPAARAEPRAEGAGEGERLLARRRAQAREELTAAQTAAQSAQSAAQAARAAQDEALVQQSDAEQRVDDLREQLAQARTVVRDAQRRATSASSERAAADKAVAAADKALGRVRDRLSHLTDRLPDDHVK